MRTRWRLATRCFGAVIGCIPIATAVQASTSCRAPTPLSSVTSAMQPFADRFNALAQEGVMQPSGSTVAPWRALVSELDRNARSPADLVARSKLMLARALDGDADGDEALAIAQAALALVDAEHVADTSLHAAILTTVAEKEAEAGKTAQALVHADAALAETAAADGENSWAYGNAALVDAAAHHAGGDYVEAEHLAAVSEQLAIACLSPDSALIGGAIQRHAATLDSLGRTDEALAEGERALSWDVAHLPESDEALADALEAFGFALRNANRLREAEAIMRRAIDLHVRFRPDDAAARAPATGKLARILAAQGRYREAQAMFLAAQALYARSRDLSNPLAGSGEMRRAADAAQAQGKLGDALDLRRRALTLIESRVAPRHPELARARIEYAATLALAGRADEGLAIATPAVATLRETAPPDDFKRLGAQITYDMVANAAGVDAFTLYADAAPAAARMEAVLLDGATRRGELLTVAPTFASSFAATARLALAAGREDEAFRALQLANLSEIVIAGADVAARDATPNPRARALIDARDAAMRDAQRLERARVAANAVGDIAKVPALDAAIGREQAVIATRTGELDRSFPGYRAASRPKPMALAEYRATLGADDVLLAPLSLTGETLVVAVTDAGLRWTTSRAPRSQVVSLIERIRASIDAARRDPRARFDVDAARALGSIIVPPALAGTINTHRHLIYYASGPLATVQPALLNTGPRRAGRTPPWLIRTHSISIATALAPRRAVLRPAGDNFLGVGAPALGAATMAPAMRGREIAMGDFGSAAPVMLPSLPGAARELRAMASIFPSDRRRLLIGAEATRAAFMALPLARYDVIAFATHGLLADALPGQIEPALVLTPLGGEPADAGLLTTSQIAGLHLDADWVILSACDTAAGWDSQSGSYSGLASAFIHAGARALLVSQWPVRDDAAAAVSVATLAAAQRGLDRPAALRQAMLRLMRSRTVPGAANPAIWAPFVLIEE